MIIRINTETKTITVPTKFKEELLAYNKIMSIKGNEPMTVLGDINEAEYTVIGETKEREKDHLNKADIEKYMENIKTTNKDLYKEYVSLRDTVVGTTKKGKELKTSFLTLKKWFYDKFPEEKTATKNQ